MEKVFILISNLKLMEIKIQNKESFILKCTLFNIISSDQGKNVFRIKYNNI